MKDPPINFAIAERMFDYKSDRYTDPHVDKPSTIQLPFTAPKRWLLIQKRKVLFLNSLRSTLADKRQFYKQWAREMNLRRDNEFAQLEEDSNLYKKEKLKEHNLFVVGNCIYPFVISDQARDDFEQEKTYVQIMRNRITSKQSVDRGYWNMRHYKENKHLIREINICTDLLYRWRKKKLIKLKLRNKRQKKQLVTLLSTITTKR